MDKLKKLSIRIISLISSFVVLLTVFLIPASATSTDETSSFHPTWDDLMLLDTEFEMQAYKNGTLQVTQYMKDPIVQLNNTGYGIHFIWGDVYERAYYDTILFSVQSPSRPVSATFNSLNASYLASSDNIHYYSVNFARTANAQYDLYLDMSSNTGELKLISCFGIIDDSVPINTAIYRLRIGKYDSDGIMVYSEHINESRPIPSGVNMIHSNSTSLYDAYADIVIESPVTYCDSISITVTSLSAWESLYESTDLRNGGGVQLFKDSKSEALPYVLNSVVTRSDPDNYMHTVTVDLTGINLDDAQVVFRFWLGKHETDNTGSTVQFKLDCLFASYKATIYQKPWYQRFFYWIQAEFMSLRSHLDRNFNSLKDKLDSVFGVDEDNSLTPDQEAEQDKFEEDKTQVDDDLQEIIDGLDDAPTVPDYDDTGLGEFKTQIELNLSPVHPIFVVIFDNPMVLQYCIYVFMFALGGFLLFGER